MMESAKNILSIWIAKRHSAIFVGLWGFVLGILISSFVRVSTFVAVLIIVIALGIWLSDRIYSGKVSKELFLIIILLTSLSFGSLRYALKDFHKLQTPTNVGVVVSEPERRDSDTRFVFQAENGEKVLVSTQRLRSVQYGDKIEVKGKLQKPGVIEGFDYGAYLAKDDIYWTESYAKITLLAEGQESNWHSILFWLTGKLIKIKEALVYKMKIILPEPEASLLSGLIASGKEALPKNVLDDFQHAGVIHIVVLSGYNVTIIAEFFLFLLGFLGKRRAAIFSAIGIILFTLMTGATATVVRAAIMVLLLLLGKILNRTSDSGRILLFTAWLMLLWNPKDLVFDPSFQLTFLAMIALIWVVPLIKTYVKYEIAAVTIATQITVLPYLLHSVGNFSLVALFSNLLILLFVPATMLVGFLATLLAFISTYIAWPLAFVSHILLWWILTVAHTLGNLSWASVAVSNFPVWATFLLYFVYLALFIYTKQRTRTEESDPLAVTLF
jgi:competence protein ComEC